MKLLIEPYVKIALALSVLMLGACNNDSDDSLGRVGKIKGSDVAYVDEVQGSDLTPNLKLKAAPKTNTVELDWHPVEGAVDYEVSRELQGGGETVVESTGGVTKFTFSTTAGQSYQVLVVALDAEGEAVDLSKVLNVKTADPDAIMVSDQAL